jgi:hypothetical protein
MEAARISGTTALKSTTTYWHEAETQCINRRSLEFSTEFHSSSIDDYKRKENNPEY